MTRSSIVIVGAGVSGLAAAWELTGGAHGPSENTPRVELIEASDRVGGALATTGFAGRTVDLGADGFLARRAEATTLCEEVGLQGELVAISARGASLWLRGALRELPTGLVLGVPTDLGALVRTGGLGVAARMAAWRDYYLPRRYRVAADATIGEIVRAKLGRGLAYQLVEPMIGGIQAGRIDELSAASVFPALLEGARRGGSLMRALAAHAAATPGPAAAAVADGPVFCTLTGGVGSLPRVLAERLRERGVVVRLNTPVSALRPTKAEGYPWEVETAHTSTPASAVILATPGAVTAALVGGYDPALRELGSVPVAGAGIVTFSLSRASQLPISGTGILVPLATPGPSGSSMLTTAVTFLDRKWPHLRRRDDTLVRAHVGRSDDLRWSQLSDDELRDRVAEELSVLLPQRGEVLDSLVQRWPEALTQYTVGHLSRVERARDAASALSLRLAGAAYDGVGVPASIGSGRRAGREVLFEVIGP